jgi:tape measure domain-containing protein
MANFDIVARLKLAGEEFSREFRSRMGSVERDAVGAGTKINAAFSGVSRTVAGLASGLSVAVAARQYLALADEAKTMAAQLKLATAESGNFGRAQADVQRIADETFSALSATTTLYGSFVRSAREAGKSQADAARSTETFSKALKLSGADAAQAASATLQFGQALNSGVLRGEEFNSIMEASPRLVRLLADALGVPIGSLRGLAEQGKITSDVLFRALTEREFTAKIDDEFKQLPMTFGDAMTRVRNAGVITFGAFDRGGEFSTALANFVAGGTEGFSDLEQRAEELGGEIRATIEGLAGVWEPFQEKASTVFQAMGLEFGVLTTSLRDQIGSLLSAWDDVYNRLRLVREGEVSVANLAAGGSLIARPGDPLVARSTAAETFYRNYDRAASRLDQQRARRNLTSTFGGNGSLDDMFETLWGNAGVTPSRRIAPSAATSADEKKRSARDAYEAFKRELQREGLVPTSGFRTFEQQASLYRRLGPGNAARPGTSDHERYLAFDFAADVDRVRLARAANRAGVSLGKELVHGRDRHLHQTFSDGLGKGGGEQDLAAAAEKAAEALERQREEQQRITSAIAEATAETQRHLGYAEMVRQGMGRQAEIAQAIDDIIARYPEATQAQLAALIKVTEEKVRQQHLDEDAAARAESSAANMDVLGANAQAVSEAWDEHWEEVDRQGRETFESLSDFYYDAFRSGGKSIWEDFKDIGLRTLADLAAQWTIGALTGQPAGMTSILGQLNMQAGGGNPLASLLFAGLGSFGGGRNGGGLNMAAFAQTVAGNYAGLPGGTAGIGAGIQGAGGLAQAAGAAGPAGLAISVQQGIGQALGLNPLATLVGGVIGGGLFKLLQGTKRGSATLAIEDGAFGVGATRGNSKSRISTASGLIGDLGETLDRIAAALDGDIRAVQGISFGVRDKNLRLDPTGRGITKTKNGAIDFGQDQEGLIRKGVEIMLSRSVIGGITATQQKLLAAGGDLERALDKAVMVGEIPKKLRAYLDPVGAAVDEVIERWKDVFAALEEGSASAQEMAEAQKLYRIELEETKARTREASADLKDFLKEIAFGSASPFSLRDQRAMAEAELKPFLDKIGAGERIDQAKYTAAAQSFLDIERQLFGSTGQYFQSLDRIQAATGKAIADIDNAKPIRTVQDPFTKATADSTAAIANISDQMNQRLAGIEAAVRQLGGGGPSGFPGGGRGFYMNQVAA